MRRWKAVLEEHNYELKYKLGSTNVVADILSRIKQTSTINSLTAQSHSDNSYPEYLIPCTDAPINAFRNQIFLKKSHHPSYDFQLVFPKYHRHIVKISDVSEENLKKVLKQHLNPSVLNGIMTEESIMGVIQEFYPNYFQNYKVRYTQKIVEDVISESDQETLIIETHNRAHRNAEENKTQIIQKYFFPSMAAKIKRITQICQTCKEMKYDRHPNKPEINETPIPKHPGHTVHFDIFSTDKHLVLTSVDKLTKYAQARIIASRSVEDIRKPLREILFNFGIPNVIVIDSEKLLNSSSILFMLQNEFKIKVFTTPPYKSEINGQSDGTHRDFPELLEKAVNEYNFSVHSVTKKRPIDLFFGRNIKFSLEDYDKVREKNIQQVLQKQVQDIEFHNKKRQILKDYSVGQEIFVKQNKRLGTKLSKRFKKKIVAENRHSTVKTQSGKIVHKSNIRN